MGRDNVRHPLLSDKALPRLLGRRALSAVAVPSIPFPAFPLCELAILLLCRMVCEMPAGSQSDRRAHWWANCRTCGRFSGLPKRKWPRLGGHGSIRAQRESASPLRTGSAYSTGQSAAGRRCGSRSRRWPSGGRRSRPPGGRKARRRGRAQRKRSLTSEIPFSRQSALPSHLEASLCIPDANIHILVCIAACDISHCSIMLGWQGSFRHKVAGVGLAVRFFLCAVYRRAWADQRRRTGGLSSLGRTATGGLGMILQSG